MMVTVYKLGTDEEQVFSCHPEDAVIAAYAQSQGDFNTWAYKVNRHYRSMLKFHGRTLVCGDFATVLPEKIPPD